MTDTTPKLRPLAAEDLEAVVAIDRRTSGSARRGFFEKRFAAQEREPEGFISLAATDGSGQMAGFLLGHVLTGEFGIDDKVVVLDAIGVLPELQGRGYAQSLMQELESRMKAIDATEVRTEAAWSEQAMLSFFAAAGFSLASRMVLERSAEDVQF